MTPKKPNSARRPVAKIRLSNKRVVSSYIPGIGHNFRKHSVSLVRYGRTRDLPSIYSKCIRGVYDLLPVSNRLTRRSIYGIKQFIDSVKKLRRKFRQL